VGPTSLDHVALWVADRDRIADFATAHLGMHVIERTDRFTLIGVDARRGKLTLFEAEGPREPGALRAVGLRVSDLGEAAAQLPEDLRVEREHARLSFELFEGLRLTLVQAHTEVEYDLDHVAVQVSDAAAAAEEWLPLGFGPAPSQDGAPRVEVAGAYLELHVGDPGETDRPLLNHLGVLVDSADEWRRRAEEAGAEVADVVDAPNTYAVFVWGPERVKLEYVEHKPGFSLT
jgi:catechol 2,3-dioxygenase-like lactoylglutathione lyase family enzyme